MAVQSIREIVRIDPEKCNGCGQCVPACAEGAIQIVDGKARLVADNLCDGLGKCLGECPQGAITIERRPAEAFDEEVVGRRLAADRPEATKPHATPPPGGCPGAALRRLGGAGAAATAGGCPGTLARKLAAADAGDQADTDSNAASPSRPPRLGQWPVQLALVPSTGAIWQDADVLIAADCVAAAMPDFHERVLAGRTLAIACPKLDDLHPYVQKLTRIFAENPIRSLTVAHMEVPCCSGIVFAVQAALDAAGRTDLPVRDVTVGVDGAIQRDVTRTAQPARQ